MSAEFHKGTSGQIEVHHGIGPSVHSRDGFDFVFRNVPRQQIASVIHENRPLILTTSFPDADVLRLARYYYSWFTFSLPLPDFPFHDPRPKFLEDVLAERHLVSPDRAANTLLPLPNIRIPLKNEDSFLNATLAPSKLTFEVSLSAAYVNESLEFMYSGAHAALSDEYLGVTSLKRHDDDEQVPMIANLGAQGCDDFFRWILEAAARVPGLESFSIIRRLLLTGEMTHDSYGGIWVKFASRAAMKSGCVFPSKEKRERFASELSAFRRRSDEHMERIKNLQAKVLTLSPALEDRSKSTAVWSNFWRTLRRVIFLTR